MEIEKSSDGSKESYSFSNSSPLESLEQSPTLKRKDTQSSYLEPSQVSSPKITKKIQKIKELQAAASRKYSMLQRKMTLYNFDEDVDPNLDNHHKSSRKYA